MAVWLCETKMLWVIEVLEQKKQRMLCMTENHALKHYQIEFLKWGLCSWLFNEQ